MRIFETAALPDIDWVAGDSVVSIRADIGGFVLPQVTLCCSRLLLVTLLAIQYDAFGNECRRYLSPSKGHVLSYNVDALRGSQVLWLLVYFVR